MEKEIWKWILETFSDESIANLGKNIGLKIPGFRQMNPQQKNFKIYRQKLIQEALHQRYAKMLNHYFTSLAEETADLLTYRGQTIEELLEIVEEKFPPSMLISVLLSSEDEEDVKKAKMVFTKLRDEERLEILENQIDEQREELDAPDQESSFMQLQEELKLALQKAVNLERKLKKSEQKNEDLKSKVSTSHASFEKEKKKWKEEKKALSQEIQEHKGVKGTLKTKVAAISTEKEMLQEKIDQQAASLNKKDDEIARLNALLLKLRTDQENTSNSRDNDSEVKTAKVSVEDKKIKVAVIGDPKNSKVKRYEKFELIIIEAAEIHEEKSNKVLDSAEQIWLLTYMTPKGIQKRVRSLVKDKPLLEFATFIDLENFMVKG